MTSQPIHYEHREDALKQAQGELLEALLQPEADFYPWNPAEPEAECYFSELERGFLLSDWQEEDEIIDASQAFFNRLHQCWASPVLSETDTLTVSLSERFAAFMPQTWLAAIANKARQVFSSNLSFADQLVLCVKPLLDNWAEEDLLVLARPLAFAMRSTCESSAENIPGGVRPVNWTELSPIEQVRLSLAVAHSALIQLNDSNQASEQSP
jgi:hypothetical protein